MVKYSTIEIFNNYQNTTKSGAFKILKMGQCLLTQLAKDDTWQETESRMQKENIHFK